MASGWLTIDYVTLTKLGPSKPAAFDLSVTSKLNTQVFQEARVTEGSAALAAQTCKHRHNDKRCRELGWVCIPLVVETYRCRSTDTLMAM